ncbi:Protein of unknown function [Lactobacillus hominis DSM 23910 = CRBIP 24.179]|uniref:Uncharacterized protein n=1 Tax=Lactobacillus hominis DSM 23910 = CRBIP 24.179 TaxID=1423758 RepID=I7KHU6_9LACO|nr:Protein of unknown function [Lactobacillus hominis DSM 23910 = CRBIP 24.179]
MISWEIGETGQSILEKSYFRYLIAVWGSLKIALWMSPDE